MSLYFSDISAKTTVLVTTSYYGKKYTNRIRLILGLIICVLSTVILSITEFVAKYITMDIDYLKMPVKAMLDMNNFAFDTNIGSGLLIIYGGRVLLTVVLQQELKQIFKGSNDLYVNQQQPEGNFILLPLGCYFLVD